jgi:hypothetical protein
MHAKLLALFFFSRKRKNIHFVFFLARWVDIDTCSFFLLQEVNVVSVVQELLPILPSISSKILPDILSRLSSRVFARVIREAFLWSGLFFFFWLETRELFLLSFYTNNTHTQR